MPSEILFQFLLVCLIIEATPGPNMGTLALLSLEGGRRAGMMMVAGIATGLALLGLFAAFGMASLLAAYPLLYQWLRWLGIAYLLWIAWSSWRGEAEASPSRLSRAGENFRYVRHGLILNLLNPKAAIFYVSVLPGFINTQQPALSQTLILTAISVMVATAAHSLIVLFASRFAPKPDGHTSRQKLRRIFAVLLALVALWIALAD